MENNTKKGGVFYGWIAVVAAWFIYLFNVAMPMYGGSVLNSIVVLDMGLDEAILGPAVTLHTALVGCAAPFVGVILKKKGFKLSYILGSIFTLIAVLGYLFLPMTSFMIVLYYGVLIAFGIGMGGSLTTQSLIIKWFEKNQSMAMALVLTAGAIGGFIGPIIMNTANELGGWKAGWAVVGVGSVIAILLATFVIKNSPEEIGEIPDGHAFHEKAAKAAAADPAKAAAPVSKFTYSMTLKEAMASKEFYLVIIIGAARTALYYSILGYIVVHAVSCGVTKESAALVISVVSITSLAGRLLTGVMGKAGLSSKWILFICTVSITLSGLILFVAHSFPLFLLAGIFAGFSFGVSMVCSPMIFSEFFGRENFSVIYGAVTPVTTIIGSVGPAALGAIGKAIGYAIPFGGMGVLNAVCIVLCLMMKISPLRYQDPAKIENH